MRTATSIPQPQPVQPLAVWNPTLGFWEIPHLDLFGQQEQFWETWPTSGWMRHGSVYPLPQSAHHILGSGFSFLPVALLRTPLASDSTRGGESLDQVRARRGTIAISHQIIDLALHGPYGSPAWRNESETLWTLIDGIFTAGESMPTP
ncbi:hypothetical protein ACFSWE_07770 [Leucobacter albus]|uniref:Uncharacterized protein n=1 Tax=Leucobacter albus TaxID=272210 RepID=A0ABW3TLR0_9MICO